VPESHITGEKLIPVLYLDLDGTVRKGYDELGKFVNGPEDVEVFPEVPNLLMDYKNLGWRIVACSNQGGIALGHMTLAECAKALVETQKQCHGLFDKMSFCMHHPNADIPEMAVCWCRKPRPGMVIEAALELATHTREMYPPHLGIFVGDRAEDMGCAENAGLRFVDAREWRAGKHLEELRSGV
jgi:D-glycero-D-manno-heptose 1,7-bisphosphate phosphatase